MNYLKNISFSVFLFFLVTSISHIEVNTAFAQNPEISDPSFGSSTSIENLLKTFESPQLLLEQLSIDFGRDISTIDLLGFSFGMVAYLYGTFIDSLQDEKLFL